MNFIKNIYLNNNCLTLELDDYLSNLIKPFIKDNEYVYLGEYPLIIPDKHIQNKLNKKASKQTNNEVYNILQINNGKYVINKYSVIVYNDIKYICINEDNKRTWIEITPIKWKVNNQSLEYQFNKDINEEYIKTYVINDMFQNINKSNLINELIRLNKNSLKEINLYNIINNSNLNFNSLTSEEVIILSLMLGLFKGKKYKLNEIASLLNMDYEEVLFKYKNSINKLEIIINKSLNDENKNVDKLLKR